MVIHSRNPGARSDRIQHRRELGNSNIDNNFISHNQGCFGNCRIFVLVLCVLLAAGVLLQPKIRNRDQRKDLEIDLQIIRIVGSMITCNLNLDILT